MFQFLSSVYEFFAPLNYTVDVSDDELCQGGEREVWVRDLATGDTVVFVARSLYGVYERVVDYHMAPCTLYWMWTEIDPSMSFEYYGMENHIQFVCDVGSPQEQDVVGRLPTTDDECSDTEEFELQSGSVLVHHAGSPRQNRSVPAYNRQRAEYNRWLVSQVRDWREADDGFEALGRDLSKMGINEPTIKLVENVTLTLYLLYSATSHTQRCAAAVTFLKLQSERSAVVLSAKFLGELALEYSGLQSGIDDVERGVTDFRSFLSNWDDVKRSALGKKYAKVGHLLVKYGVIAQLGISSPPPVEFCNLSILDHGDFIYGVVDALSYTMQRALMYRKSGDWELFVHGPTSYMKWYDEALDLKRKGLCISNLEVHGTDYHAFVGGLKSAIEQGKAILKFASKEDMQELKMVKYLLSDLLMVEANVLTRKAAQQERRAPFGILVFGGSGVAKSHFTKLLFNYYGLRMDLPIGDEYKFTRHPTDPFWSNFTSQQWCIQMDDIGYLFAGKAQIDESLNELLQVVNNVPFCPNQAALEDKGKTPVRARCVIATTNVRDLNASAYFQCPLAVQRRLPWVIDLEPKPEYSRGGAAEKMIDPSKIPALDGDWPNLWFISVYQVLPAGEANGREMAKHELIERFSDVNLFLDWFGEIITAYDRVQQHAMGDDASMNSYVLCKVCNRTQKRCQCPGLQTGLVEIDQAFEGPVMAETLSATLAIVHAPETWSEWFVRHRDYWISTTLGWLNKTYWESLIFQTLCDYVLSFAIFRWFVRRYALNAVAQKLGNRKALKLAGLLAYDSYVSVEWLKVLSGLGIILVVYKLFSRSTFFLQSVPEQGELVVDSAIREKMVEQPTTVVKEDFRTVGADFFERSERENVWVNKCDVTTTFDLDPRSLNYATLPPEQVVLTLRRNTARLLSYSITDRGSRCAPANALCVGGHRWVTNNHVLVEGPTLRIELKFEPQCKGTSTNVSFSLEQSAIFRDPENDLAWFEVFATDARKDIRPLIARDSLNGAYNGLYIGFSESLVPRSIPVKAIESRQVYVPDLKRYHTVWGGHVETETIKGDCGTVLVAMSPQVVVLGLHQLGGGSSFVGAARLTQSILKRAEKFFTHPVIQSGVPRLCLEDGVRRLGPLHHRSSTRWLLQGSLGVFGSFVGFKPKPRSKVIETLLGPTIRERRGWTLSVGRPDLGDWRPWNHAYVDILDQKHVMRSSILRQCIAGYTHDVLSGLSKKALAKLKILDEHTAINGAQGVRFLDKMNFNTSMGEPWCHSKKYHTLPDPIDGMPEARNFDDETLRRAHEIRERYRSGIRACPVFSGQQKDEVRDLKKIEVGKNRIFTGAPADWSLVVRQFLLTFIVVFQENQFLFEGFPGCVAQSLEWEAIREYLVQFGLDRIVAGDYGKFDKKMLAQLIIAAFEIIANVLRAAGWSESELLVIACIGEDTAYAFVCFNGDLVEFFGSNPSGHPLTVIINCIVNSLYMRYCYVVLNPEHECGTFKERVALGTYGDDNTMGVSLQAPWFNHPAIVEVLSEIGVEYTMPDKESASVPYVHIDDVTFLKRSWRWDEEIGAFVCPLEESSIRKSLCIGIPSSTITREMHMLKIMLSAVNEWFWYGRERFETEREFLTKLALEFDLALELEMTPFPTWEESCIRFWAASKHVTLKREGAVEPSWINSTPTSTTAASLLVDSLRFSLNERVQLQCGPRSLALPFSGVRPQDGQHKTTSACGLSSPSPISNLLANTFESNGHPHDQKDWGKIEARASNTSVACDSECLRCVVQSDDIPVTAAGEMSAQQTTSFLDETMGDMVGYVPDTDSLAEGDGIVDAGLAEFLRRPVRIANFTWAESDALGIKSTISPWNLFFNDASIKYKLNNYAFIRCNLKLKFIVNASPFYYGLMKACYQPLPSFTTSTIVNDAATKYFIPYSQQPHVNILPQASEGAVMTLPFFWQRNWLRVGRAADFTEMANLRFIIWAALQSANGVTGQGCTVQVYAWAEDVVLSGPTLGLSMQSDEYGVGPVSGPASTVARLAGMIKGVPIIGKFATATEMGANAISGIAKLFGFTNVPVIAPAIPFRMNPFPPFASPEIGYPVEKLTLDPKNELTIDPSTIGLPGHDELAIEHLVSRESYLCTATWTTATVVDTLLFGARVTPFMFDNDGATTNKLYFTPMAMVANLFQNWRGDVIFTFHFITSPYHKGRVRISYDPYATSVQTAGDVGSSIYNTIVDLGEQSKVEVRIPYQQALAWLQVDSSFGTANVPYILSGSSLPLDDVTTNGIICLKALTLLTAPVGTSSVSIIVSVRGAENLEFANPVAPGATFTPFTVQSGDLPMLPAEGGQEVMDIPANAQMHLDRYRVNFGECVKSVRPLLRRSNYTESFTGTSSTDQDVIMYERHSRYPLYYGYDPNGLHAAKGTIATGTTFPFNWVVNTPYHWLAPCFIAQKGSVFWHYNAEADITPTVMYASRINHIGQNTVVIGQTSRTSAANSATANFYAVNTTSTAGGMALTNTRTESGLSVGVPNYTQFKFQSTAPGNCSDPPNSGSAGYDGTQFEMVQVTVHADGTNGPKPQNIKVHKYFGVGTDFNLYFFLNTPTYYRLPTAPVAV